MARIVISGPPLRGHLAPLRALASALAGQGHSVRFIDFMPSPLELDEAIEHVSVPLPIRVPNGVDNVVGASLDALREFCLAGHEPLLRHCASFRPDYIVSDQQLVLASAVSRRLGCPYIHSMSTPALLLGGLHAAANAGAGGGAGTALGDALRRSYVEMLSSLAAQLGIDVSPQTLSPFGNLCFASRAFCGAAEDYLDEQQVALVGPAFPMAPATADDNAIAEQVRACAGRKYLVSMGSVLGNLSANREAVVRLFRHIVEAVDAPDGVLLFSATDEVMADTLSGLNLRGKVIVRPFLNQFFLMPQFDLVFSHGGYNTVAESLYHGVPSIAFPFVFDQAQIAHRLADLGIGVCLSRSRHTPALIRHQVEHLLVSEAARAGLKAQRDSIRRQPVDGSAAIAALSRFAQEPVGA